MTAFERLIAALEAHGSTVRSTGRQKVQAQCPAHEDRTPSLCITGIEGQALIYCQAGCATVDVLASLNLSMADLFDTRRGADYRYDNGRVVHRRLDKTFPQSGTDRPPQLYRLAKVRAAVAAGVPVYIVEGEKDVHALEAVGATATTSPMGAGKWDKVDPSPLYGGKVVVIADQDGPGREHAARVVASLRDRADVSGVAPKVGKDDADHVAAGYGVEDFVPHELPSPRCDPGDGDPGLHGDGDDGLHRGQVRMAYRLADTYADRLMHVHGIGWHRWDGARWAEDDTGAARRAVLDVLKAALVESLERRDRDLRADVGRCESAAGIDGVLAIASSLTQFAATVRDLDTDPYLLNVANGTLDLRTMQLRDHDPADRITRVTRAAWHPSTGGPETGAWASFIAAVLPDPEVRGFLQRVAGVGLLGKVVEHILPIQTGTGANGKGTAYKAQLWALGDYAATAEPDLFMHREGAHPTGEMDLRGRRWVVVSESDKDRQLAEATMKRLTGGDPIKARRMRQDFIEFEPSHTAVLVTNHLPKVTGDDPAIWRRVRVIPFEVTFTADEQDTTLDDRLRLDADAVLAWAVDGYRQYVEIGLSEPKAVRVATDRYQLDSDAVSRFIEERCLVGPHFQCPSGQLFDAWTEWYLEEGLLAGPTVPGTKKLFGQVLGRKGFPDGRSGNVRFRRGIALAAAEDPDV